MAYKFVVNSVSAAEAGRVMVNFTEKVDAPADGSMPMTRVGGLNINMDAVEAQDYFPDGDVYEMTLTKMPAAPTV